MLGVPNAFDFRITHGTRAVLIASFNLRKQSPEADPRGAVIGRAGLGLEPGPCLMPAHATPGFWPVSDATQETAAGAHTPCASWRAHWGRGVAPQGIAARGQAQVAGVRSGGRICP